MRIGLPELLIILAIIIVLFGAKRLPEIGSGLAGAIKGFRKGVSEDEKAGDEKGSDGKGEDAATPPENKDSDR